MPSWSTGAASQPEPETHLNPTGTASQPDRNGISTRPERHLNPTGTASQPDRNGISTWVVGGEQAEDDLVDEVAGDPGGPAKRRLQREAGRRPRPGAWRRCRRGCRSAAGSARAPRTRSGTGRARCPTASPRPRKPGLMERPMWASRLWVSIPHSSASPTSSSVSRSTTEKQAASGRAPSTSYGCFFASGETGTQGRLSARDRVATSLYSSAIRTGMSDSCRARRPTRSPRSMTATLSNRLFDPRPRVPGSRRGTPLRAGPVEVAPPAHRADRHRVQPVRLLVGDPGAEAARRGRRSPARSSRPGADGGPARRRCGPRRARRRSADGAARPVGTACAGCARRPAA